MRPRRRSMIEWAVTAGGWMIELWREPRGVSVRVYLELRDACEPEQRKWVCVIHELDTMHAARAVYRDYITGDQSPERRLHPSAQEDGVSFVWDEAPRDYEGE